MPLYRANSPVWLAHENRLVKDGEEFETVFPKVKVKDGTEVEMQLGSNITLLDAPKAAKSATAPAA